MAEFLGQGAAINDLLRVCFRLNRSLVDAAQLLTDGTPVTGAQWGVLTSFATHAGPGTVAEVARRMNLARQSVQRVADVLEAAGLVEYLPNPADKRAKLVRVTSAGAELLDELEVRQQAWLQEVVGNLGEADIAAAARLVDSVAAEISAGTGIDRSSATIRVVS
jgi:DNA-binding MarR family transcriptional regulator